MTSQLCDHLVHLRDKVGFGKLFALEEALDIGGPNQHFGVGGSLING